MKFWGKPAKVTSLIMITSGIIGVIAFIALGTVVLCIIVILLTITIARRWGPKLKWFTNKNATFWK